MVNRVCAPDLYIYRSFYSVKSVGETWSVKRMRYTVHTEVLLHLYIPNHSLSILEFWVDNMKLFNTILHSVYPIEVFVKVYNSYCVPKIF